MKRIYILILSAVLLNSCDFFYKTIEYKGEVEDEQMVLTANLEAGKTPRIFLNASMFFSDSKTDTVHTATEKEFIYGVQRKWIKDAVVEMQINDGEWQTLTGAPDTIYYYNDDRREIWNQLAYSYKNDYVFQPGDLVRIRATHPNFQNQVAASQKIPQFAGSETYNYKYNKINDYSGLLEFDLTLPPYEGNEGDIMNFVGYAYLRQRVGSYYDGYDENFNPVYRDTLYDVFSIQSVIYSRGLGFEKYDNFNYSLSLGYWGARSKGLYHNANTYGTEVSLPMKVFYHPYSRSGQRSYTITDSIVIEVKVVSKDYYRNASSLIAATNYYNNVPDYWSTEADDAFGDISDIINDIQDSFAELGNMEGVQVFSNVDGGFGHVTASATERIVIEPGYR